MSDSDHARIAGRQLAERHVGAGPVSPGPVHSLVNYAESPRVGDWTLRSAMVRLASPEPMLVVDLATLVRRLDATVHHVARVLEKQTVTCDRAADIDNTSGQPILPYPDTRTADLARLALAAGDAAGTVIEAYNEVAPITDEERGALPLLGIALSFDALAGELAHWATTAPAPPPVELIGTTCAAARDRMDELGVPTEDSPPPGRGRRG